MGEQFRIGRSRLIQLTGLPRAPITAFAGNGWRPAVNAYRCDGCIRVCVDLAGVDTSVIQICARRRSLVIRGQRLSPEPNPRLPKAVRVLAMEIDHGPFERELFLEAEIEPDRISTEQQNGLLWITLPLRAQG